MNLITIWERKESKQVICLFESMGKPCFTSYSIDSKEAQQYLKQARNWENKY